MNPPNDNVDELMEKTLILFGSLRQSINKVEPRMKYILMPGANTDNPYYYGDNRVIKIEQEIDDLFDDLFE